jgi:uncharacterized membrane protein YfcA
LCQQLDGAPRGAVASAVGLAGGISAIAGAFSAAVIARVLDATGGNYTLVFLACASVYVIATGDHSLSPAAPSRLRRRRKRRRAGGRLRPVG